MPKNFMDRINAKPPHQPPYVIENAETLPRFKLASFLGVDWLGTPYAWVSPIWILSVGELISFLGPSKNNLGVQLLTGLGYAFLIAFSIFTHNISQIISGKIVNAPAKAVVITATLFYQEYGDKREYPSRIHLVRAISGPLGNLLLGCGMLVVYFLFGRNNFALFLAIVNLVFTLAALTPVPTMDGGEIIHELRHWRSE